MSLDTADHPAAITRYQTCCINESRRLALRALRSSPTHVLAVQVTKRARGVRPKGSVNLADKHALRRARHVALIAGGIHPALRTARAFGILRLLDLGGMQWLAWRFGLDREPVQTSAVRRGNWGLRYRARRPTAGRSCDGWRWCRYRNGRADECQYRRRCIDVDSRGTALISRGIGAASSASRTGLCRSGHADDRRNNPYRAQDHHRSLQWHRVPAPEHTPRTHRHWVTRPLRIRRLANA
jgi:hypothetical protein